LAVASIVGLLVNIITRLKSNAYLILPSLIWLSVTLNFTLRANIYADDAGLIGKFQVGNLQSFTQDFANWVPGRNLTIFFQYLLFSLTSSNIDTFWYYHFVAQVFYLCIGLVIGNLVIKFSGSKFLSGFIVLVFLCNPLNAQVINWSLGLPQHILSTLISITTIYLLFRKNSRRNKLLIMAGLVLMIFTYDQSAALAIFIIFYSLTRINVKLNVITLKSGVYFNLFGIFLILVFVLVSYFGRISLGFASNLSKDSLGLLKQNLYLLPKDKASEIWHAVFGGIPQQFVLIMATSLAYFLYFKREDIHVLFKQMNLHKAGVGVFFLSTSFVSFLPAALWYPDKRHYFLPGVLLLLSVVTIIIALNFTVSRKVVVAQRIVAVISVLCLLQLQMNSLKIWDQRDDLRKEFYLDLSATRKLYPEGTNFFVDDSNSYMQNLFYSEYMPSAYSFYNNDFNSDSPRIHQLSKIGFLETCTKSAYLDDLFIEVSQGSENSNLYFYEPMSIEEICN
jgi:hypothetical protein